VAALFGQCGNASICWVRGRRAVTCNMLYTSIVGESAGDDAERVGLLARVVLQHKVVRLSQGLPGRSASEQYPDKSGLDDHAM